MSECPFCKIYNKPNKETLQAMKDADEGKNLIEYDSVEEMFEDCGWVDPPVINNV